MQISTTEYDQLVCPNCSGTCLHHSSVTVYEREEDDPKPLQIHVEEGRIAVSKNNDGNPSPRRHGLRINFWCEECDEKPSLKILQHKGATLIEWEKK